MKKNKFIYFPSVSSGAFGNIAIKNGGVGTYGLDIKYWNKETYSDNAYPYILVTAGHRIRNSDVRKDFSLSKDVLLMSDSGGYQVATGAIQYTPELVKRLLKWTEDNFDIGMNLDIPPRMNYAGKFKYALNESLNNFKYFIDNRSNSNCSMLNVMQGSDYDSYKYWYDAVSKYKFEGWSLGGVSSVFKLFINLEILLKHGNILEDESIKYFHHLGTSKLNDLVILMYIQQKFTEAGSNIIVTSDSSSPSLGAVYGRVATTLNTKQFNINHIKVPSYKTSKQYLIDNSENILPEMGRYSKYISNNFNYQSMIDCYEDDSITVQDMNAILVLHNLGVYIDSIEKLRSILDSGTFMYEQFFSNDLLMIFKAVDDIFAGAAYESIIAKYGNILYRYSQEQGEIDETLTEQFWD